MDAEREREVAAKLLDYYIRITGLFGFEAFFGGANLPKVAEATGLTPDEVATFITQAKERRLALTTDTQGTSLSERSTLRAWQSQENVISGAMSAQGKIIQAYIEAHRNAFRSVEVQNEFHPSGQPTRMLVFTQTHRTYYYHNGKFYRKVDWQRSSSREGGDPPIVHMIVGEELQALWRNGRFVRCLLGEDSIDGSMPLGAM
ncbi:MAG: hypothetical protein HY434_00470 [Candidatus Liptonbacteria bacterium]|nr:hypothetical protein [Candidatus Liptonbacteria bacterium]